MLAYGCYLTFHLIPLSDASVFQPNTHRQLWLKVKVMIASVIVLFTYVISCYYVQVMFENYQFEGVYIAIQAVLTLYAQGEM